MKKIFIMILAICLLFTMSCARNNNGELKSAEKEMVEDRDLYYGDKGEDREFKKEAKKELGEESSDGFNGEKIIQGLNIDMNTMNFDDDRKLLESIIKKYNAIISNSFTNISENDKLHNSRFSEYNLRIDAKKLQEFKQEVESKFNVVLISESKDNITNQYYDSKGRLKNLEIQRERIREILKKAEKIEDIIKLEKRLSELDYKIESFTNDVNRMDNDVKYSFVRMALREVRDPAKLTRDDDSSFGVRIKNAFANGFNGLVYFLEELIVFVISVIPLLIIVGIVLVFVIRYRKKLKSKKEEDDRE